MTDSSSYRVSPGASSARRDEPSVDPARNGVGDPLAELARLIGHYEACGAIVRDSARQDRQEPRVELSPRHEPLPPQRRPGQPQSEWDRDDTQSAHDRHGGATYPLAGSTSPEGAAGKEGPYPVDQYCYDEPQYDDGRDYADALPKHRRGLGMFAAVIGLALVGSAGAFGYRLWSSGGNGEPPLMTAGTTLNKVAPATQGGESPSNKPVDGRFNEQDSSAADPRVPRDETPAELTPATPGQIFPSAGSIYGPGPSQIAVSPQQPTGVIALADARKVRTERIWTNEVSSVDSGQTGGSAPPVAPSNAAPKQDTAGPAPLVFAARSPAAEPGPTPPPAGRAAPAGNYVVQLSSQRSEGAAQATSRTLQTKYPNVFGSRQPFIRRSDLGDRGVFYRAQVGPFATIGEANQFCGSLKKAGGECIVQRN